MDKKHIVILGAGYAGLTAAVKLQKTCDAKTTKITLVNKNDYHYETTWLHEVSAGTIKDTKAHYSIESLLNKEIVSFVKDTVIKLEPENKKVVLENGTLEYDYLVVSLGFESETFGIEGLSDNAHFITNINSANKIFQHINNQISSYASQLNVSALNIVVGGAGFTGVEFLGELINKLPELCSKYGVDRNKVKIICVESSPSVLSGFHPKLIKYAVKQLERKGVEFKTGTAIKSVNEDGVTIQSGEEVETIESKCVIWSAGVRGSSIVESSRLESSRGKVKVDEYLRAPGYDNVFVIGDNALIIDEKSNRPYPPTAQISMQEAVTLSKNLSRIIKGNKNLIPFEYKPKGTVCSLGHHDAIGYAFGIKLKGYPASVLKKIVDNRALFIIGGLPLVMKKGKLNL